MQETNISEHWQADLVGDGSAASTLALAHSATSAQPLRLGRARRAFDIVASIILIILLAPVFVFVGLAVRFTSPGPVFYCQTRVGINRRSGVDRRDWPVRPVARDRRRKDIRTVASAGRLFRIVKFRTMIDGAEASVGPTWATENDSRITSIGKFLRRTRLDEIPQLFNVLKGDMSFIGPRPERPFFVERFRRTIPGYMERLTVPPGITGLAQVEHCYDASEDDVRRKLEYDLRYLRNKGWRTDLSILGKTVIVVISGSGAR